MSKNGSERCQLIFQDSLTAQLATVFDVRCVTLRLLQKTAWYTTRDCSTKCWTVLFASMSATSQPTWRFTWVWITNQCSVFTAVLMVATLEHCAVITQWIMEPKRESASFVVSQPQVKRRWPIISTGNTTVESHVYVLTVTIPPTLRVLLGSTYLPSIKNTNHFIVRNATLSLPENIKWKNTSKEDTVPNGHQHHLTLWILESIWRSNWLVSLEKQNKFTTSSTYSQMTACVLP